MENKTPGAYYSKKVERTSSQASRVPYIINLHRKNSEWRRYRTALVIDDMPYSPLVMSSKINRGIGYEKIFPI